MNPSSEHIRIDKFLWAVRIFKTRSLAVSACKGGKVKLNGNALKPSKEVSIGDVFTVQSGIITRILKIIDITQNRIGPKLVELYIQDLTPSEEYELQKIHSEFNKKMRPKGLGRPTKKERRKIDEWSIEQ
ncbi:MAG: RNA-binding S4 domain-containing protein [Bacteroidales bacterium]|nr:RNA-binding S4 domain-containing protein [Bacteroidales bacterium]